MEEGSARVWVVEQKALLDDWLGLLAALLDLNAYADKLWIPRSGGLFHLTERNCAQKCEYGDIDLVGSERYPELSTIETGEEKVSTRKSGPTIYVFHTTAKKHALEKTPDTVRVAIPPFSTSVRHALLQHAGTGRETTLSYDIVTTSARCISA